MADLFHLPNPPLDIPVFGLGLGFFKIGSRGPILLLKQSGLLLLAPARSAFCFASAVWSFLHQFGLVPIFFLSIGSLFACDLILSQFSLVLSDVHAPHSSFWTTVGLTSRMILAACFQLNTFAF